MKRVRIQQPKLDKETIACLNVPSLPLCIVCLDHDATHLACIPVQIGSGQWLSWELICKECWLERAHLELPALSLVRTERATKRRRK